MALDPSEQLEQLALKGLSLAVITYALCIHYSFNTRYYFKKLVAYNQKASFIDCSQHYVTLHTG